MCDLRFQHSQQRVRLWQLLQLTGLVSAQTNNVAQSLWCIGLPLWKESNNLWGTCYSKCQWINSQLYCNSTSSSLSGWMSSMSLWANFSSFNHCWRKWFETEQSTWSKHNKSLLSFVCYFTVEFICCVQLESRVAEVEAPRSWWVSGEHPSWQMYLCASGLRKGNPPFVARNWLPRKQSKQYSEA